MKTNTISNAPATIGNWPGLRKCTMAATLLSLLTMAAVAQAQVTIYQDSFARTGALSGSAPDTVNATGATWLAWPQIITDGTEAAITNLPVEVPNAYLPFTVLTGHIYTLTASLFAYTNYLGLGTVTNAGANWLWLGYSVSPVLYQSISSSEGVAWMLHRATNGGAEVFKGPGTTAPNPNFQWPITTNFTTYSVILSATNDNIWTVTYETNGGVMYTISAIAPPTANNGMRVGYVGFGANGATGHIMNFSLTDTGAANVAPTIYEQPNNATAQVGQTATFWVNALGVSASGPSTIPTYQWMTNSPGGPTNAIPGATNAVYTTPALSSSYNGLSYTVAVTSGGSTVNSTPGTLTVVAGQPTIFSATKTASGTNVVVMFSGPVDTNTGLNVTNYSLNNGASVLSASAGNASGSVILTTSALSTNLGYYLAVQNVQDLYSDVIANAYVPVLPASLVLFLRGDSGVIVDNSNNVVQWLDQTTNGNNAVQFFGMGTNTSGVGIPGPQARPATNSISGNNDYLPALNFNPANSNFLTAAPSPSLAINGSMTVYAYVNPVNYTSVTREVINKAVGNQPGSFDFYPANGTGGLVLYRGDGNGGGFFSSGAGPGSGAPHLFAVTSQNTGTNAAGTTVTNLETFYIDGNYDNSGNVNLTIPGALDCDEPAYIGYRSDHYSGDVMYGQIAEIMLFNSALSGADRTNVDNYLGVKYYPFSVTQPPSNVTTNEGDTATFTVAASEGSAHLSYQWQVETNGGSSFTNIAGATNASYTTWTLAPTDNNDQFDVQIIVPGNSTNTSSPATLTVNPLPPTVTSVGIPIWSQTNIIVLFSEAVDPVTATTVTNYSLNNGASVLSAAIGNAPNQVVLTTSALTPGVVYTLTVQNVMNLYGKTILPASPSVGVYPPYTALWLKASTGVTADANGNVSQWNDLSGNTNNMIQTAGPPYEPQLATNAYGDPVIRFTGTNETYMYAADSPTLEITGDMSIFAVVNFATLAGGTNGEIVSKTCANKAAPYDYYFNTTSARFYRGNCTGYAVVSSAIAPVTGTPQVFDVVMQGTTVTQRLDGDSNGSGTLSTTIGDTGQPVYIGTRADTVNRLTGDLAELIVIGSALSSNDVVSMENYLAQNHYLQPPGAPLIVQNPQSPFLAWPGDTVANSVSAIGTQPFYYQWQFGGSNLTDNGRILGPRATS